jgi:creatinine amidohydrolase
MNYINLRPKQLVEMRSKKPVAYIGLGILEWHGLHNPLGLDGIKANAILEYIAEELGGIVMPPLFWGDNREDICELVFDPAVSDWLPEGTEDHSTEICDRMQLSRKRLEEEGRRSIENGGWRLWEELMVHCFFQIESLGFKMIVPYPGHYPLIPPLKNVIDTYRRKGGSCRILVLTDQDVSKGDHAAMIETSLLLRLKPDLVDLNELNDNGQPHLGVLGADPLKHASAEYGEELLQALLETVEDEISNI